MSVKRIEYKADIDTFAKLREFVRTLSADDCADGADVNMWAERRANDITVLWVKVTFEDEL